MPRLDSLTTPDDAAFRPYAGEFSRRASRFQAAAERPLLSRPSDTPMPLLRGGVVRGSDAAALGRQQEARAAGLAGLAGNVYGAQLQEELAARAKFAAERDAARRQYAANVAAALGGVGEAGGMGLSLLFDRLRQRPWEQNQGIGEGASVTGAGQGNTVDPYAQPWWR